MIFFKQFFSENPLAFAGLPSHIGSFVQRSQVLFGGPVTREAPPHSQGLVLADNFHLVNSTMTGDTPDSPIHMGAVVEVNEVGKIMDANPIDGEPGLIALTDRFEFGAIHLDFGMAIHAGLGWRNGGVLGLFHGIVAITAIQSKLSHMERVAIGNGLLGCIPDSLSPRVSNADRHCNHIERTDQGSHSHNTADLVNPFRKD